jgi:hypothetical protein
LHSCCSCCYTHQSFKAISQSSCHFCIGFYCCCEKNHLTTSSWVFCICKIGFSLHTQKARLHIDCWTLQHRLMLLALHTDHKICSNLCVSSKQASSFWCVCFLSTLCFLHKFSLLSPCKFCSQTFVVAVVDF